MALTVGELRKYLSDESISDDTIFGIMEFANNNSIKTLSPKRFLLVDSGVKGWDKKMLIVNQMGTHWNNEDWGKRNDSKIIGWVESPTYKLIEVNPTNHDKASE